jgi:hypothetical protein
MVGIDDGLSAGRAAPHQRLKTSSIQSDHSALRQIIGSQSNNGIACLHWLEPNLQGDQTPSRRSFLCTWALPQCHGTLFTIFYAAAKTSMKTALMRIQWGLVYAP